jgi:hypothetical protein
MSFGAIIMLLIGAIGLWGGLVVAIRHYFAAVSREGNDASSESDGPRVR